MGVTLRERELSKGRTRYYLDIIHNKKRFYEFLFIAERGEKKEKKALAEVKARQRASELQAEGTSFVPKHKRERYLLDYFNEWTDGYKKADKRLVECSQKKLVEYMEDEKYSSKIMLLELDDRFFRGFADYLNYDAGLSGETPHNYWQKFKSMILQATRENLIKREAFENVKFQKKDEGGKKLVKKQIVDADEIKTLMHTECGNDEVKRAFLFATYTGLGLAEINNLKWENIQNGRLQKKREKSNIMIDNALSETAQKILGERGKNSEYIFNLRNKYTGKPSTEAGINKVIKTWVKRAGITKHITFYSARHSFAVRLVTNGANLKSVADAMGHTNTATTNKYLRLVNEIKDEATRGLD